MIKLKLASDLTFNACYLCSLHHLSISNKTGKVSGYPKPSGTRESTIRLSPGATLYEFSVASAAGTGRVIDHCTNLLQGYKYYQLAIFVMDSKVFKDRSIDFFE